MSGSSWDYAYRHVEDFADRLEAEAKSLDATPTQTNPLRAEFAILLRKVADAMHDIEWVDSSDKSPGDENAAIRSALRTLRRLP